MPEGLEEFASKYKLHDESLSYIKQRIDMKADAKDYTSNDTETSRRLHLEAALKFGGEVEFTGTVREFKVPSAAVPDGIPITVFDPRNCGSTPIILVFFHGGAYMLGSREETNPMCKVLARDIPCIVVNVEYRLAPEHKFPACFEDGKNVVRWVQMNKSLLGGVNDSKVGLMGSSCGGAIAAAVCHEVKGIAFQVQVCPWLDLRNEQPSCVEFASAPLVNIDALAWFAQQFVTCPEDMENVRVCPLLRPSFTCLPPTLLLLAEFDPLRDQAYEYKRKIKEAGVDAESLMIKGSIHGFFSNVGHFKELGQKARERLFTFIKKKVQTS